MKKDIIPLQQAIRLIAHVNGMQTETLVNTVS